MDGDATSSGGILRAVALALESETNRIPFSMTVRLLDGDQVLAERVFSEYEMLVGHDYRMAAAMWDRHQAFATPDVNPLLLPSEQEVFRGMVRILFPSLWAPVDGIAVD